jgi:hypothetical protein
MEWPQQSFQAIPQALSSLPATLANTASSLDPKTKASPHLQKKPEPLAIHPQALLIQPRPKTKVKDKKSEDVMQKKPHKLHPQARKRRLHSQSEKIERRKTLHIVIAHNP